ncbi:MAG: hypothetical protein M3010_04505, partial [Candidatus Dormibacteraeota bacterium]|nr:hypothetical protein [Candidatus Dormibacteraeota bacterium]
MSKALTRSGVGFSNDPDSRKAGHEAVLEALAAVAGVPVAMALGFCTSRHDMAEFALGMGDALPPTARTVCGNTVGVMAGENLGYGGSEVGVVVLTEGSLALEPIMVTGLGDDEGEAGRKLGTLIPRDPQGVPPETLIFYDSVKASRPKGLVLNHAVPMLDGLRETLGGLGNLAGAGLMGDFQGSPTRIWLDGAAHEQALLALVLGGGGHL